MKRRKRFSIRLVALGLAAVAIAAPAAQAVPYDTDANRVEHPGLYASAGDVVSPDDRAVHATWPQQPPVVHDDDGFGITSIVSGLVLLLMGGVGVALAVRSARKGRLAPA